MLYQITHLYFEQGAELIFSGKEEKGPYHLFSLYLEGDWFPILSLTLLYEKETNSWVTHVSELSKEYRKKGYGKAIYSYAINYALENKMNVCSSKHTSGSAKRVWNSLKKDYNINYIHGRFWL